MKHIKANRVVLPAGGGDFQLDQLTIGVFLNDQPTHHLFLGADKGVRHPLRAQEGWVLPQGAEGVCRFDHALDVMMVSIDGRVLTEVGLENPSDVAPLIGAFDPLLRHMALNAESLDTGTTLYRETMQRALAAHVAQIVSPAPEVTRDIDDDRLARAVAFIHDNLATDLSLEDMADQAAMSAYHFSRAFKAQTGASPLQFVISARMDAAKVLLKTTKLPIAQIAHRVGYEDLSRFGRHFKTRVGVTPKAFREG